MTLPEATARARAALRSAGGCRLISANAAQATDKWQMSVDGTDGRTSERNIDLAFHTMRTASVMEYKACRCLIHLRMLNVTHQLIFLHPVATGWAPVALYDLFVCSYVNWLIFCELFENTRWAFWGRSVGLTAEEFTLLRPRTKSKSESSVKPCCRLVVICEPVSKKCLK